VTVGPGFAFQIEREFDGVGEVAAELAESFGGLPERGLDAVREMGAQVDHLASAQAADEGSAYRIGRGERRSKIARHRDRVDLHHHAGVVEVGEGHRGDDRCGGRAQQVGDRGQVGALVDAAVVHIEDGEAHQVGETRVELVQDPAQVGDHRRGLGHEVVWVQHLPRRVEVALAAGEQRVAAVKPHGIGDLHGHAPVSRRRGVPAFHRGVNLVRLMGGPR
jgi:hypothetical protein